MPNIWFLTNSANGAWGQNERVDEMRLIDVKTAIYHGCEHGTRAMVQLGELDVVVCCVHLNTTKAFWESYEPIQSELLRKRSTSLP